MANNFIVFLCFLVALYIAVFGALGLYINSERGRSKRAGFFIGCLVPIMGLIFLALRPSTEKQVLTQAVELNFINRASYARLEKTVETKVTKKPNKTNKK